MLFNTLVTALAITLGVASAAPADPLQAATRVQRAPPTRRQGSAATHTVVAGRGGLHFDPENVVAEVGDVIEWHFLPKNHSIVRSSFDEPCKPLEAQLFSGGFFPVADGQSPEVFQFVVQDDKPVWFYCAQTVGSHCQNGMVGVVNQNFNSANTLAKHKELAAKTNVSIDPQIIIGGARIPNPNPTSGV